MTRLAAPLARPWSRLRAPVRLFGFWSQPARPPYTEFPLVTPVPSEHHYTSLSVPGHILRPQYADTGQVDRLTIPKSPVIWSQGEINKVTWTVKSVIS